MTIIGSFWFIPSNSACKPCRHRAVFDSVTRVHHTLMHRDSPPRTVIREQGVSHRRVIYLRKLSDRVVLIPNVISTTTRKPSQSTIARVTTALPCTVWQKHVLQLTAIRVLIRSTLASTIRHRLELSKRCVLISLSTVCLDLTKRYIT
jgi:hypothetical protein